MPERDFPKKLWETSKKWTHPPADSWGQSGDLRSTAKRNGKKPHEPGRESQTLEGPQRGWRLEFSFVGTVQRALFSFLNANCRNEKCFKLWNLVIAKFRLIICVATSEKRACGSLFNMIDLIGFIAADFGQDTMIVTKMGRWAMSTNLHWTSEGHFLRDFGGQWHYMLIDSGKIEGQLCSELGRKPYLRVWQWLGLGFCIQYWHFQPHAILVCLLRPGKKKKVI